MTEQKMATNQDAFELKHLQRDIQEIKSAISELSRTIARISVFEERLTQITSAQETLRHQLEQLDERQRKLESEHIYAKASARTLAFTAKIAWALGGGVIMSVLSKVLQAFG